MNWVKFFEHAALSLRFLTTLLCNSMHQNPWEVNTSSGSWKNSHNFMESKGSLPHTQEPATRLYEARSIRFMPPTPSHFFNIHFNIIFPSMCRSSKVVSFPQVSPPKPCMHLTCLCIKMLLIRSLQTQELKCAILCVWQNLNKIRPRIC